MSKCMYCNETLANNDDAANHAGECLVMNAEPELCAGDVVRVERAFRVHGVNGGWEWSTWEGYIDKVHRKTADVIIKYPRTGNYAKVLRVPLDRITKVGV